MHQSPAKKEKPGLALDCSKIATCPKQKGQHSAPAPAPLLSRYVIPVSSVPAQVCARCHWPRGALLTIWRRRGGRAGWPAFHIPVLHYSPQLDSRGAAFRKQPYIGKDSNLASDCLLWFELCARKSLVPISDNSRFFQL